MFDPPLVHWYAYVGGGEPDHVPGLHVRTDPTVVAPLTVGATVFAGPLGAVGVVKLPRNTMHGVTLSNGNVTRNQLVTPSVATRLGTDVGPLPSVISSVPADPLAGCDTNRSTDAPSITSEKPMTPVSPLPRL